MPCLRRTAGDSDCSDHRDFEGLVALATLAHFELHRLTLFERAVAIAFDVGEVHEHVGTALSRNEAIALLGVEELHGAGSHLPVLQIAFMPNDLLGSRTKIAGTSSALYTNRHTAFHWRERSRSRL